MESASVKYVANGYIITTSGGRLPATLYAATIPEVVFWLNKVFAPFDA